MRFGIEMISEDKEEKMIGNRRLAGALAMAVVLLVVITACAPAAPETVEVTVPVKVTVPVEVTVPVPVTATPVVGPIQGGTLVVGLAADSIVTLDPAAYSDRATETVIRNMFDGLVTRTTDNEVVPELAESYEWIDDTTCEFVLKQGVTFHNGEPLTADDVVYSFERILAEDGICGEASPRKGFLGTVTSVEKVDDYTVRFYFESAWAPFLQMLVHNQVVPQDYLEEVGCDGFVEAPVGAGPYMFVEGALDGQIVMARFEDYYGGADDLPPVGPAAPDEVIFKMIPETSTRVAALLAGEADIIQGVPSYMVPRLIGNPDIMVKTCAGTRPKFVDLNYTMPPFDDVRVRRALNYAVDAETLLGQVAGGYGVVLPGPLSPFNNYADPTLEPYGHDPDEALALLAEVGWADTDEDGILDKGGVPFSFILDAYGDYVPIAEAVAGQLRAIGIDVSVRTWEYSVVQPLLLACERQAFLRDWGDSAFDPVGYIEAKWHTLVEGTSLGRANFACYSNARVDELIEAGAIEVDPEERHAIYNEMQRLIYDDAAAIFLYVPQEIEACHAGVQNWEPSPDSRVNLHDVWLLGE
jgi:peptide/nickel transport system substrate-binding protein